MTQPGAVLYTQGYGSRPENVEVPHVDTRAPTTADVGPPYALGKRWIYEGISEYTLLSFSSSTGIVTANWSVLGTSGGPLQTLTTQDSVATAPVGGNININGASSELTTTGSGSTVTIAFVNAVTFPGSITTTTSASIGTTLGVTGLTTLAALTQAGTALINTTGTAATTIGGSSGLITIAAGSGGLTATGGGNTISLFSDLAANVVTLGSASGAASLALRAGTGNMTLSGVAATTITVGLTAQTGTLTFGSSSATNVIVIGGGNGANTTTISGGTGGNTVAIATGAGVNAVTLGSTHTTSETTIQAGTAGLLLTGGQVLPITSTAASTYVLLGTDQVVAVDPTSNTVSITLPASPATGRHITVFDATGQAATHTITVNGNGNNISAAGTSASTATLTTAYSSLNLWFNGTIWNAQKVT